MRLRPRRSLACLAVVALAATTVRGDEAPRTSAPDRAAEATAAAVEAAVREARELLRADLPAAAAGRLEPVVAGIPGAGPAWTTLGEAQRKRCQLALARAAFERALELDAADPAARAGLADVFLQSGEPDAALATAQAGIDAMAAAGTDDGRPWRAKALALIELRRYDLAAEAGLRATTLCPDDPRCAEAYASALFRAGRISACRREYQRAVALDPRTEDANMRLGNGFGPDLRGKPWKDGDDRPRFEAALAAWDRGDLDDAMRRFLDLAAASPQVYKYRLGLGLSRVSIRRRNEAFLGGDAPALYARLPGPEVEGLDDVVLGYGRLRPAEQHVVRVAVAPSRRWVAALRAAGASHEVVPLAGEITDAPSRRGLEGKASFDGRWYAHLRGVGGSDGATGEEKLREAAEFGFNTFAHEWGHQLHRHGLSAEQQARVGDLYRAAVAANACLDYYAASNEDEYFAQGYEAFVSVLKRGCLPETARHTRRELARRDPALYDFLLGVLDTSHESPDVEDALLALARGAPPVVRPEPSER
ncbi:MAG: tetratricopeptide repeat protein [Planctomycetia bacterium]|nr:tetratricopeptide repeat protein [Planctomycetia bacterium]